MAEKLREQLGYGHHVSDQQGVFIQRRRASQTQDRPRRTVQPQHYEEEDDALYEQRPHTSARRYLPPQEVYTQGNRKIVVHREPLPKKRTHWTLVVGIALCIMVLGWVAFGAVANWWQEKQNDWTYGTPRTFQTDQYVGMNDSPANPSHFIAMNLRGTVFVIFIEGGDPTKAQSLPIIGLSQDQVNDPVTISFDDVNGDGKPDMLVHVAGFTIVLLNTGKTFQAKH